MTMPQTHLVAATVHGRYLLRKGGPRLLAGFHGYAENAEMHMAQLEQIPGVSDWTIASVQALHPFYTRGDQMVVASWMTRMDREPAIADNIAYVKNVISDIGAGRPIVFLGFSQGAAMAYRAAAHIECDGLVVLGADVPPDVAAQNPVHLPKRVLVGRGDRDDLYTSEKLKNDLRFLRTVTEVKTCLFDGGHEWTGTFRAVAGEFLRTLT